jgi:16S rRNA (uracil1498-N3)-methyltransferase
MRLHRFYIEKLNSIIEANKDLGVLVLSESDLINQLINVFRYKVGDELVVFNESGTFLVRITEINKKSLSVQIVKEEISINRRGGIIFAIGIPKKDKFELIVEKLSEIGVSEILPIVSERTEKTGLQISRLNKISVEATEQSGQNRPLIIRDVVKLSDVADFTELSGYKKYFLDFGGVNLVEVKDNIIKSSAKEGVLIFIGPEGGWGSNDIEFFRSINATAVSLGGTVLKTETAAIVAAGSVLI